MYDVWQALQALYMPTVHKEGGAGGHFVNKLARERSATAPAMPMAARAAYKCPTRRLSFAKFVATYLETADHAPDYLYTPGRASR